MSLWLDPAIASALPGMRDPFDVLMDIDGTPWRRHANRCTLAVEIGGKACFIKRHTGAGWGEIFKNLLMGKWPVLDASNEWRALLRLRELGICAAQPLGFGWRGTNPAGRRSFVLMSALEGMRSLATLCGEWREKDADPPAKRALIGRVARLVRTLHEGGMIHRDLYLCHFLLGEGPVETAPLCLIDLHRARVGRAVTSRWRLRDLAALDFSARECGLTRRDRLRFLRIYRGSLRETLRSEGRFWRRVERRAVRLARKYARHMRRDAARE